MVISKASISVVLILRADSLKLSDVWTVSSSMLILLLVVFNCEFWYFKVFTVAFRD